MPNQRVLCCFSFCAGCIVAVLVCDWDGALCHVWHDRVANNVLLLALCCRLLQQEEAASILCFFKN